jgi:hypothetical protein
MEHECSACGEMAKETNGVIRRSGTRHYCQEDECQKAFHDDAGDPPDEWFDE